MSRNECSVPQPSKRGCELRLLSFSGRVYLGKRSNEEREDGRTNEKWPTTGVHNGSMLVEHDSNESTSSLFF